MIQQFTIYGRLAGLNEYTTACRQGGAVGGAMKRREQERVQEAIRASGLSPMERPVRVSFHWIEPNMRRDKDNVAFAKKFILDALVAEGIIENDNWAWVDRMSDEFAVNADNPRVIVRLFDGRAGGCRAEESKEAGRGPR